MGGDRECSLEGPRSVHKINEQLSGSHLKKNTKREEGNCGARFINLDMHSRNPG